MIQQITSNIYEIKVRLAGNPLRDLNSYVILSDDRNLLIDTGFNTEECLADLQAGIAELGLDMTKTDLFITHLHSDHCGLVSKIVTPETNVYMGSVDKGVLVNSLTNSAAHWHYYTSRFLEEGYPPDMLREAASSNAAKRFTDTRLVDFIEVSEGSEIRVGDMVFTCIDTPGHSPGHLCLYNKEQGILFLGDHVLFDITPNISIWYMLENPLKKYLESLDKIYNYDVKLPLPAHRSPGASLKTRIDELKKHHKIRLDEARKIVEDNPGIKGYDVAARMTWSIRAKDWDDFPPPQKWFAVGEALSHLDYLVADGSLIHKEDGYYPAQI